MIHQITRATQKTIHCRLTQIRFVTGSLGKTRAAVCVEHLPNYLVEIPGRSAGSTTDRHFVCRVSLASESIVTLPQRLRSECWPDVSTKCQKVYGTNASGCFHGDNWKREIAPGRCDLIPFDSYAVRPMASSWLSWIS